MSGSGEGSTRYVRPGVTVADITLQRLALDAARGMPVAVVLARGPDGPARSVAVHQRLFVGRTCHGIDPDHRLLIGGNGVSRDHCQIRIDPDRRGATLVDTSTNGTRLNGTLVERSVPIPIADGDVVTVGSWNLLFRTTATSRGSSPGHTTMRLIAEGNVCVVCGDLVDYTTLTQLNGGPAVFAAMHALFDRLRDLLHAHRGTLYDYVGDAFLAMWEESVMPDAARRGLDFAVAAVREIAAVAPGLALRGPDGGPLRMGWAVTHGPVAMSTYAGSLTGLLGDVVNVGFRLASTANRAGRSAVVITEEAVRAAGTAEGLGEPEILTVKGHTTPVVMRQVRI